MYGEYLCSPVPTIIDINLNNSTFSRLQFIGFEEYCTIIDLKEHKMIFPEKYM